ncbi:flagellar basal body L-ring protein FlgH, partial [Arthrospira platensis SPKY1]|nr:flagellar basal body L-ring protein FlgH [Arthrospira platensis SPKY1]
DAEQKRSFDGEADAGQSNSLTGNISVTVAEVMPNGLLRIRGEKWLTIAEGDEFIRLSGLVRPEDITIDNTVVSTKIADARIAYSATGAFADVNRAGWMTRFFNSEWWPL